MTTDEKEKILRVHPIFKGLDEKAIKAVAEKMQAKIFPPKTIIFNQGEEAHEVYFIYKGLIKAYIINREGKPVPIGVPRMRYILGEVEPLVNELRSITVETILETHSLLITKKEYVAMLTTYNSISLNIMKVMADIVIVANKQRENTVTLPLKDRTWAMLQTLATQFPHQEISLSQEELAYMVGGTRARITEILNLLQKQQLLSLANRKIKVL